MLRWYLIQTKPSGEALAESNLGRQGYELYLPRVLQRVRSRGTWRQRIVALFPRYLFLQLNEGLQALAPVRSTLGVAQVVRFGARYTVVPDEVICDLRSRADPATGLHRLSPTCILTPGAAVRIRAGAFEGIEAVFEREAGTDRVVVLLKLLGQFASVCLRRDEVVLSHTI